jgi:hypothetical protein
MSFFERITGRDRSGDSRRQVRSSAGDFPSMSEWDSPRTAIQGVSSYKGKDPAHITPEPFRGSERTTPKPDKKPGSTKGYVQRSNGEDF